MEFIGAWSPAAWGTGETFIFFVAIIVGGLGNNFGAFFGAFLVLGVFLELPTFLPQMSNTNIEESLQSAAIGVLILVFLWWRPQGIFPERRRKLSRLLPGPRAAEAPCPRSQPRPFGATVTAASRRARTRARSEPAAQRWRCVTCSRVFGGVQAVDGLSFELAPGQATGLIGPNGAGQVHRAQAHRGGHRAKRRARPRRR